MKKIKKTFKPRNHIAMDLFTPKYHMRVVPDKRHKVAESERKKLIREIFYGN